MRFTNNKQLNDWFKISYKFLLLAFGLGSLIATLVIGVSRVNEQGYAFTLNGAVAVFGKNATAYTFNTISNISVITLLIGLVFLFVGICYHMFESKISILSFPMAITSTVLLLYSTFEFFIINLPTSFHSHLNDLAWLSMIAIKVVFPILFALYVIVFMENKPRYSIREFLVRHGWRILVIFILFFMFATISWFTKKGGLDNSGNILNNLDYDSVKTGTQSEQKNAQYYFWEEFNKAFPGSAEKLLDLIHENWVNHELLSQNDLIHYSSSKHEFPFPDYVGIFVYIAFALIFTFGLSSLLVFINRFVVINKKYVMDTKAKVGPNEIVDVREESDTLDLTPIIEKDELGNIKLNVSTINPKKNKKKFNKNKKENQE